MSIRLKRSPFASIAIDVAVSAMFLMIAVMLVAIVGCSGEPLSTREKGTLIGAGVGAGGGALVGSAVGHPGAGAAIGGAAGGVAGYAIGNHEQNEENRQRYREYNDE